MTSRDNEFDPDYCSPPGETLQDVLDERGWRVAELAQRLELPTQTVHDLLTGAAPITPALAVKLEQLFSIPADFWNHREQQYRELLARQQAAERMRTGTEP